jgi:hypothetical protein
MSAKVGTMTRRYAILPLVVAAAAAFTLPVQAQVRDAAYRGTLVCGKLSFAQDPQRAAIEVKLAGNEGPYERPVHMPIRTKIAGKETGTAKVEGDKITLAGGWKGEKDSYEATYSGTFVRRSAKLTGMQTWTHEGKTHTRNCSGVIQRPFAAFLPKEKKPAQ